MFHEGRLRRLLSLWLDGSLQPEETDQLAQMLCESAEARRVYLNSMNIHSALYDWATAKEYLDCLLAECAPVSAELSESDRLQPSRTSRRRSWAWAAAAAVLVLGVAVWSWPGAARRAEQSSALRQAAGDLPTPALANVVRHSSDCHWYVEHAGRSEPGSFHRGNLLRVASGRLSIAYDNGTEVSLYAPAAVQLVSNMRSRVLLGRLSARVPEAAQGFSVVTPQATVVDLGTEFGVEVNYDGGTDVVVFKGQVDVDYPSHSGSSTMHRLRMGEAVRLDAAGTASRIVSISNTTFSDEATPLGKDARPIVISAVRDNIRREESWNYYEIVHAGMAEDALAYVDREAHQYNGIDQRGMPACLLGGDYVKMFNNDKVNKDIRIDVTVEVPARLYVLLDDRLEPPQWLRDGFHDAGDNIGLDGGPFISKGKRYAIQQPGVGPGVSVDDVLSVWVREVRQPGVVHLGATEAPESGPNMYGIVAVPLEDTK